MKRAGEDLLHGVDGGGEVGKRQRRQGGDEGSAGSLGNGNGGDDGPRYTSELDTTTSFQIDISLTSPPAAGNGHEAEHTSNHTLEDIQDDPGASSNGLFVPAITPNGSTTGGSSYEGTPSQEEASTLICYGMVPQIKCQRLNNSEHAPQLDLSDNEQDLAYVPLQLVVRRGRLVVGTDACPDLAYMNSKATFVLLEAFKHGVELRLFAKREALDSFLHGELPGQPLGTLCIDANVLGPESQGENVGMILSKHGVYLQDPRCLDDTIGYSNPHLMNLDDVEQIDIWFQELEMDFTLGTNKQKDNTDWNVLLDDLPQQHNFDATRVEEVDRDIVITTAMPHQGEALDFMCKRELGGKLMDNDLRYWQLDRNEDNVPVYRHTVTADEKYESQPEPQGGILADDMGLGKTLTSIYLMASSLDRARHFAQEASNYNGREGEVLLSRATLVVVPSTQLMDSWIKELEKHTGKDTLKITKYHGHERVRKASELLDYDIVLTTYGTIATEHRKTRRKVLYYLKFFRIILDEAHTIRTRRTKLFEAVTAIDAGHHWCLTGTPISNRVDDLGALLDFCRVPLLGDRKTFQQHVATVTRKSLRQGYGVLKETLKPLCLRRTRAILKIAQPKTVDTKVTLSPAEQKQYKRIMRKSRKAIDDAVAGRTGASSRNTMLKVLLELRIFCNQGTFTPENKEGPDQELDADEQLTLLEEKEEAYCQKCSSTISMFNQLEDPTSGVLGQCSHVLCRTCYDDLVEIPGEIAGYQCPHCDQRTEPQHLQGGVGIREGPRYSSQHSSKLDALTRDLLSSQNSETPEKSIVFSVWRKTLNITSNLCHQRGIRHVQIDGKTPQSERSGILHQFTHDPSISTLLMTMGTGALGLNITAASRIHILEPQWNPAVEDQAVGRAVRLGQMKDATVIRYIVENSVEKQIQGYQKRKMRLAAGGFEHRTDNTVAEENVRLNAAFLARAS